MATNRSGAGKGGKSFQDRELAASVRTLGLQEIMKVLKGKESEFKKQVILRLAGSLLPRLNEVSGENGGPVEITLVKYATGTASSLPA